MPAGPGGFAMHDDLPISDTEAGRILGWTSIAIGAMELAAPKQVQQLLGLEDKASHRGILRVCGVREIMQGIAILAEDEANPKMTAGLWGRVAGDVLDTALLGIAATKTKAPGRFATVAGMVMGIGASDLFAAKRLELNEHPTSGRAELAASLAARAATARGRASELAHDASDRASEYGHRASEYASSIGHRASDYGSRAAESASDYGHRASEYASDLGHRAYDYASDLAHRAADLGSELAHKASAYASRASRYLHRHS
jgi:hypothetical protein